MPELTGSVGEAPASNKIHDVTLVQVLLRAAQDPKTHRPFYPHDFDGKIGPMTRAAIVAFQAAYQPAAAPPKPAAGAGAAQKSGPIEPGGATFLKLVEVAVKARPELARLRVLPGTKMAYLEATDAEFQAKLGEVQGSALEDKFKAKVVDLVKATFKEQKIALAGWNKDLSYRRSFADQHDVLQAGHSHAGPGESNHQFGQAIDVGYVGLNYLRPNGTVGTIKNEHSFDHDLQAWQREALYRARNALWEKAPQGKGTLFRIRLGGQDNDPNHFQGFNQEPNLYPDPTVSVGRSLAEFLGVVSNMKWSVKYHNHHNHYSCDLGLGGTPIEVGTADEIWTGNASLTKAQYVAALNAQRAKANQPALKDSDVKQADFDRVFKSLEGAFDEADRRWKEWTPRDANGQPV